MTKLETVDYRSLNRALKYYRLEIEKEKIKEMKSRPVMKSGLQIEGMEGACGLCRFRPKSMRSFAKDKRICKSCLMRNQRPWRVNVSGRVISAWRGPLTQTQLADLMGMDQPNIVRMEKQRQINGATACKLATALTCSERLGNNLRRLVQEWPLFPLLVDFTVVACHAEDGEVSSDVGRAE